MKQIKKLAWAPVAVASALLWGAAAQAGDIDVHGYFRTQVGSTSKGGNLQCFQPASPASFAGDKFRLGNECDTYGELFFGLPFGDPNGVWGKYHLTMAYKPKDANPWEETKDDTLNLANTENFFEAGGFFPGGMLENSTLWVGKRYNRTDIHILDYYYWQNNGVGAGLDGVKLGPVKAGLAYFQRGGNGNASSDITPKRYSLRAYDLEVNKDGKLSGELVYFKGSTAGSTQTGKGMQLFLQHEQGNVLGGFNKLAVVLGRDLGAFPWAPSYADGGISADGAKGWRIHEQLMWDLKGTGWSGMATANVGRVNSYQGNDAFRYWNVGVRPQYNFTKNFSVAVELGHQEGKQANNKPRLTKLTLAPQLALGEGFWARPVLRAFVTHAKWNDDAGTQANGVFGTSATSGTTYGLQAEAWW